MKNGGLGFLAAINASQQPERPATFCDRACVLVSACLVKKTVRECVHLTKTGAVRDDIGTHKRTVRQYGAGVGQQSEQWWIVDV